MILLNITIHWANLSDGVDEQFELFEAATGLGDAAFVSPNQLFLLTDADFEKAAERLVGVAGEAAFVSAVEVAGRFVLAGRYPESVHRLIERASEAGAVSIGWSNPPEPPVEAEPRPTFLH